MAAFKSSKPIKGLESLRKMARDLKHFEEQGNLDGPAADREWENFFEGRKEMLWAELASSMSASDMMDLERELDGDTERLMDYLLS